MPRIVSLAFAALALVACSGADLVNLTSFSDGRVEKGVAYGSLDRQKLDIYRPDGASKATVMFVYGGSWQEGERGDYAFVGEALANAGYTTAIPDYRLYPDVRFPAFVEDSAAAFSAIRKESDGPVFVMGHSAGAQIAALLSLDGRYLARHGLSPCRDVAGLIGVSGPYDFLPLEDPEFFPIFPVPTRQSIAPINFAGGKHPPSLLIYSRDDEVVKAKNIDNLTAALKAGGNRADKVVFDGASHAETIGAMARVLRSKAPTYDKTVDFLGSVATNTGNTCR